MDNVSIDRQLAASRLAIVAHLCGILAAILMVVWLLHYRGGIQCDSKSADRIFNVHPFLMYCGFIFLAGEGMVTYRAVKAGHRVLKSIHSLLHLAALCLGAVGICAAFKFHHMVNLEDMYSLHSWIGMATLCFFFFQWLFGFSVFLFPGVSIETRAKMLPWVFSGAKAFFYMAIGAALTGLMEKTTLLGLLHHREARLINFTALSILFFGIFVDLSVSIAHYV